MGKTTVEQKSKLMISRDKFCDDNFDKLVIETSHSIALESFDSPLNPKSSSQDSSVDHQVAISIEESPSQINYDHNRLNQPKRPMNAFMVWGQAIRRELHHKFSNVQNALLSKALGRVWRLLDYTEKEPFVRRANLIKANHKRDYPNYRYQPRRMQEKRARNNMLIGINLNHPVNQLQNQQSTTNSADQITIGANHQLAHSSLQHLSHLVSSDNKNFRSSNSKDPTEEPRVSKDSMKDNTIDGVQKFEYYPYPAVVASAGSTIECNKCRPITITSGCPSDVNYREGQIQTSIYPPYQQLTYDMNQNQHHQNLQQQHYHQQHLSHQPFSYEVIQQQSSQMDSCSSSSGSQSLTNNATGLYYGSR